jgi:hypothetical protein
VKLPQISAGEFFELMRPAAFLLSAALSILVLASTRRRGLRVYVGLLWALGTFILPFVILPLYLIALIFLYSAPKNNQDLVDNGSAPQIAAPAKVVRNRFWWPALYGFVLLGATVIYLYRDYNNVDAHLARATQAKLASQPANTIREYRMALSLEDNPHTHKLLGIELAEEKQWAAALDEFRLAERGGEPDDSLAFRTAWALEALGKIPDAVTEYQKFVASSICSQPLPDEQCAVARQRLKGNLH